MDYTFYLGKFQKSANQLNKKMLHKKQLEVSVGVILDSVFLKLYKKQWTSDIEYPLNAEARIFFSVWVNDKTILQQKIFYNIHALKLRKLKGYSISSKIFANDFRTKFKNVQHNWENVSVKFGPLTLMEGWKELDIENLESIVVNLAYDFFEINDLIDNTLKVYKITKMKPEQYKPLHLLQFQIIIFKKTFSCLIAEALIEYYFCRHLKN